jgi:hypothetical protein
MINTTNIQTTGTGSGVPKTISPGNVQAKLNGLTLENPSFKPDSIFVILALETVAPSEDFEGFFIDKDDESKGRYAGQVGRVKATEWPFADGTTKSGYEVSQLNDMKAFIKQLCDALSCADWLIAQNNKHETIESLYQQFDKDKPFVGKYINWCIAGKEYQNKSGYTAHDLFLPKFTKDGVPFEAKDVAKSKLITFNSADHIKKKKVSESVTSFSSGDDTPTAAGPEFDL